MKQKRKPNKKGGDAVVESETVETKPVRGRPVKTDREEIVLSNGLFKRQWLWIQKEADAKGVDAAWYQRFMVDMVIDSVEASRAGSVATPEEDKQYERLVKQTNHKKKKQTRSI